jgi:V/A-type H+/Na+-transporting ATPase subunit D
MLFSVSPNRMQLLRLKRRLAIAKRGYKLLKDKRDALIQEFINLVKITKDSRKDVEEKLNGCYISFTKASSLMSKKVLEESIMMTDAVATIEERTKSIMSVKVPQYQLNISGNPYVYSLNETPSELDIAIEKLITIMPLLINIAQMDKSIILLAEEIEQTRRRVNALEHVLIPNLIDTIKFISMKLDEMERSHNSQLMRIKEIIRR